MKTYVQTQIVENIKTHILCLITFFPQNPAFYEIFFGATQPIVGVYFTAICRALPSSRTKVLDHTQRCATVGRTPLNE